MTDAFDFNQMPNRPLLIPIQPVLPKPTASGHCRRFLWVARRSFQEKSKQPGPGEGSGHGGEALLRDRVESTTDPQARLYKKATAAERESALAMVDQVVGPPDQGGPEAEITWGADRQYQDPKFIAALRERAVAPQVSEYTKGRAN